MAELFAQVDEIIDALVAAGIRDTSLDPAEVNVPGVWVKAPTIVPDVLFGYTLNVDLVLIVEPVTPDRALFALEQLFDQVAAAVGGPAGNVTPGSVIMPDRSVCPCYTYPIAVATEQTNGD
jgi:hypothetical protein